MAIVSRVAKGMMTFGEWCTVKNLSVKLQYIQNQLINQNVFIKHYKTTVVDHCAVQTLLKRHRNKYKQF